MAIQISDVSYYLESLDILTIIPRVHEEKIKLLALRARGVEFEEMSRVSFLPLHSNISVWWKQLANAFVALS